MGYRIINGRPYAVGNFPIYDSKDGVKGSKSNKEEKSFNEIFQEKLKEKREFNISNHAAERMKELSLNDGDMKKLNEAINNAEKKGSKNSVILYKDVAFVTSIENRTVITAVDKNRSKENIFTNIDSVVIL